MEIHTKIEGRVTQNTAQTTNFNIMKLNLVMKYIYLVDGFKFCICLLYLIKIYKISKEYNEFSKKVCGIKLKHK